MSRRLALGSLSVLLAPAAAAQTAAEPGPPAEIVVTGRGLERSPGDRAFDVQLIPRERIEQNAADRLEDVLADVAGVQQYRRSDSRTANPTSQGISLRGIGGNASSRALLIVDGVPQSDPFGGWVAFPAYATGRIGQIAVTRGGGSGYDGPGALAGTVAIDSATPDQLAPLALSATGGSRKSVDAQGQAALVRPGGFATVSGAYARGDGFVPTVAEDRGPVDRASPYQQASGAVRAVVKTGASTEVQANLSAFTDDRQRGTAYSAIHSEGADASVRLVGRGRWGWSMLGYLQTRNFSNQFVAINAARTTATETLDQYATPATGLGGRVELAPPVGGGIDLRLGGDVRDLSGRTEELYTFVAGQPTRRRVAGGRSLTTGAFADASTRGPLVLTLGGRIDAWRISSGSLVERPLAGGPAITNLAFADRHGIEGSGRAGAAWHVAAPLTLRVAGYRGWRLPTLNELYRSFRVGADATAANPGLSPERLWGGEVGIDLVPAAGVRLSATAFDNRLSGAIANVTMGQGAGTFPLVGFVAAGGAYRVRENLDAIRSLGGEVDASWTGRAWDARLSWAHSDARVRASGSAAALDGLRPAQTPLDQGSATLGWHRGGAALSLTGRYVAGQWDDDQNTRRLAPAATMDGYARLPLLHGLAVELRAENLTDTRVEAGTSGAGILEQATPRTLWIGLDYRGR